MSNERGPVERGVLSGQCRVEAIPVGGSGRPLAGLQLEGLRVSLDLRLTPGVEQNAEQPAHSPPPSRRWLWMLVAPPLALGGWWWLDSSPGEASPSTARIGGGVAQLPAPLPEPAAAVFSPPPTPASPPAGALGGTAGAPPSLREPVRSPGATIVAPAPALRPSLEPLAPAQSRSSRQPLSPVKLERKRPAGKAGSGDRLDLFGDPK